MRTALSLRTLGAFLRRALGVRLGRLHQYPPRPLCLSSIKIEAADDLPSMVLVTPSYNQAKFVGSTIRSVLEQNYPRLEYIVQDACSSDGTAEVLKSLSARDVTIRIEADRGQADALNRGFNGTSGEIMGYLNSDDLLLPGALNLVGRYFRDNPAVDVVYGNRLIIDEQGREVGRWVLPGHDPRILRFVDYVPQESLFWRRRIWDRIGASFDADLQFAMDWDLILRFLDAGAIFHHLPELFCAFRVHGSQKTQASFAAHGAREMAAMRSRHGGAEVGRLRRTLLLGRYFYRHRKADAAFVAGSMN